MRYATGFLISGVCSAVLGLSLASLQYQLLAGLVFWPAVSFLVISAGYAGLGPRVFGKKRDGTLAFWSTVLHGPYILVTWLAWYLRGLGSEPCFHRVGRTLYVGRRPRPGELPDEVGFVVDLTCELWETKPARMSRRYLALPTLDGSVPDTTEFRRTLQRILSSTEPLYIHCAMGHGRAPLLVAALLIETSAELGVDDALALLGDIRPGVNLNALQRQFLKDLYSR